MRIVCAPDSFKESMPAAVAASALARGVRRVWPDADVVEVPLADGGEGTCETLVAVLGGELLEVDCQSAVGDPLTGQVGWVAGERLAVIEVASACGIEHVPPARRDAERASTYGVGQLIEAALDRGARRLIVGLGGSATNDAGAGMMAALGVRFLDAAGAELQPGGAALAELASIDTSGVDRRLADVRIELASDVDNPLTGPRGASAVFGPQKGASGDAVARLDAALGRWADVVEATLGVAVRDRPGAGAAGGLGAAFLAFCGADLRPGIELVMDAVGFDDALAGAGLVLTGEGSIDGQSASGKVPWGVARRARTHGVPVVAFGGRVDAAAEALAGDAFAALVPILTEVVDLPTALASGPENLERAAAMVCRLVEIGR